MGTLNTGFGLARFGSPSTHTAPAIAGFEGHSGQSLGLESRRCNGHRICADLKEWNVKLTASRHASLARLVSVRLRQTNFGVRDDGAAGSSTTPTMVPVDTCAQAETKIALPL